jgi:acyl carrier protein
MNQPHPTQVDGKSEQEIRASVREIVMELAPEADPDAPDDVKLVDGLGFHSLALLELAFTLEDQFDLEPIDEDRARDITTLRDIAGLVINELRERSA